MTITVQELDEHLNTGFTRSPNELDDMFLRELPRAYYCFWRYIWRKTAGWVSRNPHLDHTRILRGIADDAGIHVNQAGRAAWFFHTIQFIQYTPGNKKTHTASHFQLFPFGIPDRVFLHKAIEALRKVLAVERSHKKKRADRNFRYSHPDFCARLRLVMQVMNCVPDEKPVPQDVAPAFQDMQPTPLPGKPDYIEY